MSYSSRRTTIAPGTGANSASASSSHNASSSSSSSINSSSITMQRNRQYSHLAAQLATLNANLADTENLLRVTSCQAEGVRGLGAWMGGFFMAASKVLGEEGVAGNATATATGVSAGGDDPSEDSAVGAARDGDPSQR